MKNHHPNRIIKAIRNHKLAELNLTVRQLTNLKLPYGASALHVAADAGCLDQIQGGAIALRTRFCNKRRANSEPGRHSRFSLAHCEG